MIPLLFMTTRSPKFINEPTPEAPPVEALSWAISDHAPEESPATNSLPLALADPRAPITAVSPAIPTLHPNLSSVANVDVGVYTTFVDEAEGLDKLEQLQNHNNEDVYKKAMHILETYFGLDDEEDEQLAPEAGQQGFVFAQGGAPMGANTPPMTGIGGATAGAGA